MKRVPLYGLALASLAATAHADVTFGGARAAGMGGAGLALPVDVGNNYRMNPAFLAFGSKAPTLQWPGLGYKLDGISISNVRDVVGTIDHGGLDANGILTLASKYGESPKAVAFNGNVGFRMGGLAIGAKGEAGINSIPNASLQTWAQAGGDTNNVPADARLDAYGYGYQQVEVGYGNSVRSKAGKFTLGANVRRIKAYYAHKFADSATIASGDSNGVQNGSGITGDFATQDSTGVDVGLLYNFPNVNNLYIGTVIENFIEPNIAFNYEAPGGGQPIIPGGFDPYKRTFNLGLGYVQDKVLMAADLVDIGNNSGGQQFRAGAEFKIGGNSYFRTGYNTQTAFTYGFSVGGFNIQLGGKAPLSLTSVIRF
ncbi:MAG: hypothetical protein JST12_00740 [Armatimonadetes bacterium]|nr:hypothetical protein [Armatimonadota bacterium]MBS1700162.1 hypothetical protein [Armatimonadota bacterium]MBS1726698.1 hypothetical protein [Armatimonadota bacterium]